MRFRYFPSIYTAQAITLIGNRAMLFLHLLEPIYYSARSPRQRLEPRRGQKETRAPIAWFEKEVVDGKRQAA